MTLFSELICFRLRKPYHIIRTLAVMLQFRKHDSAAYPPSRYTHVLAYFVHYGIGVIFSWAYYWRLSAGMWPVSLAGAFAYGAVIGCVGIVGWWIFFTVHPHPPPYSLTVYLAMVWAGHLVLGVTLYFFYFQGSITTFTQSSSRSLNIL